MQISRHKVQDRKILIHSRSGLHFSVRFADICNRKRIGMNCRGILVGAAVFLSIGICHPLVIKMEYQWGKQSWWVWLVAGLVF